MATTKKTETEQSTEEVVQKKQKLIPKQVDPHEYVPVLNGSRGKLIYISPRTGEKFVWEQFGDVQEMELQELRNARAANKKFYSRNWFMFDDDYDWVIDYLGVRAFYRHSIGINDFDDLFKLKQSEIKKIIGELSEGQRRSVAYRARQLIAEKGIDSISLIDMLEKSLGTELIER